MKNTLEAVEGAKCEIDDLSMHKNSQTEHDTRLHIVSGKLKDAKLTLKKEKCVFNVSTIRGLGQDKMKAIIEIAVPTHVAEVNYLVGW